MATMNSRRQADPPLFRIEPFKGVDVSVTPTQIQNSQSPDMLNMTIDERGAINKRTGYKRAIPFSMGNGPVQGMHLFKKTNGTETFLFAHGGKLYKTSEVPNRERKQDMTWLQDDLDATWESEVQ